jgi:hypothetical protein
VPEADGAAPGRRWAPKLGGRLWRDADFLKLWAGQSISRLGTGFAEEKEKYITPDGISFMNNHL